MNIIVIICNELEINKVVKVTLIWMESVARATTSHIGASCAQKRWTWWNLSHGQWARTTSITGLLRQGTRSAGLSWSVMYFSIIVRLRSLALQMCWPRSVVSDKNSTLKNLLVVDKPRSFAIRFYRSFRAHGNLIQYII